MSVKTGPSRLYPARPYLAVSAAIWRGGRVLLGRRMRMPLAGVYTLPGGGAELGETMEAAVRREIMEETGVEASISAIAGHSEIIERDADGGVRLHFTVICFAAVWVAGEGQSSAELDPVIWASTDELVRLPLTPGLGPIIDRAASLVHGRS